MEVPGRRIREPEDQEGQEMSLEPGPVYAYFTGLWKPFPTYTLSSSEREKNPGGRGGLPPSGPLQGACLHQATPTSETPQPKRRNRVSRLGLERKEKDSVTHSCMQAVNNPASLWGLPATAERLKSKKQPLGTSDAHGAGEKNKGKRDRGNGRPGVG